MVVSKLYNYICKIQYLHTLFRGWEFFGWPYSLHLFVQSHISTDSFRCAGCEIKNTRHRLHCHTKHSLDPDSNAIFVHNIPHNSLRKSFCETGCTALHRTFHWFGLNEYYYFEFAHVIISYH